MIPEELEYLRQHPDVPEAIALAHVADLKRQQAIQHGARLATERGVVTRAVPLPRRRAL